LGVKINTHHLLVQRVRINGIPSPLPLYAIKTSLFYILIYEEQKHFKLSSDDRQVNRDFGYTVW
jgi:hypothetical protein